MRRALFIPIIVIFLTSCATFPKTFNQSLLIGNANVTAANATIGELVTSKRITPDKATELGEDVDKIQVLLKEARRLKDAGNDPQAKSILAKANVILKTLQEILIRYEGGK